MKKGYWVTRTYISGRVGEKTKYWISGERDASVRGRRRERSEIKKQEQNEYSAVKTLARILNANLRGGELLIGLDYSDEGLQKLSAYLKGKGIFISGLSDCEREAALYEAARHELALCMRRVSRALKQEGIEFKCYCAVTSDMDGETGEAVRVHHHLVVPREAAKAFIEKWKCGGVNIKSVTAGQEDYTPLASYLLSQVRRVPDEKKYITTRNIIRPQPKDRVAVSDAELRAPAGGKLLFRSEYKRGCPQYIRYTLPKSKEERQRLYEEEGTVNDA